MFRRLFLPKLRPGGPFTLPCRASRALDSAAPSGIPLCRTVLRPALLSWRPPAGNALPPHILPQGLPRLFLRLPVDVSCVVFPCLLCIFPCGNFCLHIFRVLPGKDTDGKSARLPEGKRISEKSGSPFRLQPVRNDQKGENLMSDIKATSAHRLYAALNEFLAEEADSFTPGVVESARNLARSLEKKLNVPQTARILEPAPDVPARNAVPAPSAPLQNLQEATRSLAQAMMTPPPEKPFSPRWTAFSPAQQNAVEQKAQELLKVIRFSASAEEDPSRRIEELRLLVEHDPAWEERIQQALHEGENFLKEKKKLEEILAKGVLNNAALSSYWKEMLAQRKWFRSKATKMLFWKAEKELAFLCRSKGAQAGEQALGNMRRAFSPVLDELHINQEWLAAPEKTTDIDIPRNTNHALHTLPPSQEWNIYIDETGMKFSAEEKGSEGRVAAVCIPQRASLAPLVFHCTDSAVNAVLRHFAKLLHAPVGILGIPLSSLNTRGDNGWLQAIRELVKWVWRLLPLPEGEHPGNLRFFIEQRSQYSHELETELGCDMIQAELTRENPERARRLRMLSLEFVDKKNRYTAWADITAYCWQSSIPAVKKAVRQSGLTGTSLLTLSPGVLRVCERILRGDVPDGEEWLLLMGDAFSCRKETVQGHAIALLQERCKANPALWDAYARTMHRYLLGKNYALSTLEHMGEWLSPMDAPGITTEFFWRLSDLARMNHKGVVNREDLRAVKTRLEELTPEMDKLDPMASLHVALRLAVSDANAFAFSTAETRLARWNPAEGGRLTGTLLWDGKILSSLGQYRAFQHDPLGAVRLFRRALECFATLPREEGPRQMEQTKTYLAIASMDLPDATEEDIRAAVADALGCDIMEAASSYGKKPLAGSRYLHHLLVRYLAMHGSKEEKKAYCSRQNLWTMPQAGFQAGHPWPLIQYYRWLMIDREDSLFRNELINTMGDTLGSNEGLTVELIFYAILFSMGISAKEFTSRLLRIQAVLPAASPLVDQMLAAGSDDPLLAARILPFNYR